MNRHRQPQQGSGLVILVILVVILAVFVWAGVQVAGHLGHPPSTSGSNASTGSLRGVSVSPLRYDTAGLTAFLIKVGTLPNGALEWQGDWQELNKANTGASLVQTNATTYSYTPVLVVSAFTDAGASHSVPIRPLTAAQTDDYVAAAGEFATAHKPAYFGVGVEVNRIHETSVADYQAFVALFHRTASAVHTGSPATKVFTTFQLERLKGLRGGLFGGANNTDNNDWALLSDFSDADLIGFTSYPGIIYKTPAKLPSDYYTEIAQHTTKPIIFTELGWPAADEAAGWPSTPADQEQFVAKFLAQTGGLPIQCTIWSFLYDQATSPPFDHLGLLNADGSARPAWAAFTAAN